MKRHVRFRCCGPCRLQPASSGNAPTGFESPHQRTAARSRAPDLFSLTGRGYKVERVVSVDETVESELRQSRVEPRLDRSGCRCRPSLPGTAGPSRWRPCWRRRYSRPPSDGLEGGTRRRYRASVCQVRPQAAPVAGRNRRLRKSVRHAPRGGGASCHAAPLTPWRARGPGALQAPPKGREALDSESATWYLRRRAVLGPRRRRMIEGAVKGEGRGGVPTRDRERALC